MKKGVCICLAIAIFGFVIINLNQQKELKESNRLVLDLQSTIRMMEEEINQTYYLIEGGTWH